MQKERKVWGMPVFVVVYGMGKGSLREAAIDGASATTSSPPRVCCVTLSAKSSIYYTYHFEGRASNILISNSEFSRWPTSSKKAVAILP